MYGRKRYFDWLRLELYVYFSIRSGISFVEIVWSEKLKGDGFLKFSSVFVLKIGEMDVG